ncbi:MAG: tRNA (guanosine(37)-N1)-methyltransferase TrmD [Elusimicrobia bacterium]|nr:tRNA (guanosine(37)-N1)-methyltransferase TrmD [Elusimicrobiota bacterium]
MRIDIITLFPEVFTPLDTSIVKRAIDKGITEILIWNLRNFTKDKHKKVDDTPYGGGKGMVLQCEPIFAAVEHIKKQNKTSKVILTTPQGALFNQGVAKKLSSEKGLIIICGHYEGVDERISTIVDYEISIGDYVLTGGELPAMVITDALVRLLPGVLPKDAPVYDSFNRNLLDWPSYTKPATFKGMEVPEVLISGNHEKIAKWRKEESEKRTKKRRPDLYRNYLKQEKKNE